MAAAAVSCNIFINPHVDEKSEDSYRPVQGVGAFEEGVETGWSGLGLVPMHVGR